MAARVPLRLDVSEIIDRPGASRTFREHLVVPADVSRPTFEVVAALIIEAIPDGLVVSGSLRGTGDTVCSRCLEPMTAEVDIEVREAFLPPGDETEEAEAYPLEDLEIDLEPMIRDAVALGLPTYPRCGDDCAGLCPVCGINRARNSCACEQPQEDPRFAVLADLNLPRKD